MVKLSNLEKVDTLFQPDVNGYSRFVSMKVNETLILLGVKMVMVEEMFTLEFRSIIGLQREVRVIKVIALKLNGFNESIILNQTIRKDIKDKLNELTRSNFAPDCLIPLVDKDKEIDHRWGRKDSPLYSRGQ